MLSLEDITSKIETTMQNTLKLSAKSLNSSLNSRYLKHQTNTESQKQTSWSTNYMRWGLLIPDKGWQLVRKVLRLVLSAGDDCQ